MHNYLPRFIEQFDPEEGELIIKDWTALQFLKWLELNNFHIIKNINLKFKIVESINIIKDLPISEISKNAGIDALKLVLNEINEKN